MEKTTVYLPVALKHRIKQAARCHGQSEAEYIRGALERSVSTESRRMPSFGAGASGDPTLAERVDEVLANGFGEW